MKSKFLASSYIKTGNIFWLILPPFEHIIVNFSKYYPFKGEELVLYACFGLIHLHHTESTRSQTLCQLSQRGVRLLINLVNAE